FFLFSCPPEPHGRGPTGPPSLNNPAQLPRRCSHLAVRKNHDGPRSAIAAGSARLFTMSLFPGRHFAISRWGDYFWRFSLKRPSCTTLPAASVARRVASRLSLSIKRHIDTKVTSPGPLPL